MLLENKVAVVYGASGAVGGAVARAFAREGARLFMAARTLAPLDAVAAEITAAGGKAETALVDAYDQRSVEDHLSEVVKKAGRIDISFNLVPLGDTQGVLLVDMDEERFSLPVVSAMKTHFLTATAAGRHMAKQGSGVIMALTANVARINVPYVGGFGVACAAIEGLCRQLAVELGPEGVRVVCLRSSGSPDAPGVREAFQLRANEAGVTLEEITVRFSKDIPLRRMPLLADVANAAVLMASDGARGITAEVVNLTGGQLLD